MTVEIGNDEIRLDSKCIATVAATNEGFIITTGSGKRLTAASLEGVETAAWLVATRPEWHTSFWETLADDHKPPETSEEFAALARCQMAAGYCIEPTCGLKIDRPGTGFVGAEFYCFDCAADRDGGNVPEGQELAETSANWPMLTKGKNRPN